MLSANESLQATQAALDVVSFYEELEALCSDLLGYVNSIPAEYRGEGLTVAKRMMALQEAVGNAEGDGEAIRSGIKSLAAKYPSKIKRLGIANQIIEMRAQKSWTLEEIADRFGISVESVRMFLIAYESSTPKEKAALRKTSVYDIKENMESLHAMMLRALSRFETDGEINSRNLAEYRQLLALAQKQLTEMSRTQKLDELAAVIEEVLLVHCSPESRKKVIAEFQRIGLSGFLKGMGSARTLPS